MLSNSHKTLSAKWAGELGVNEMPAQSQNGHLPFSRKIICVPEYYKYLGAMPDNKTVMP
ncbi:MAG: endo-beta-N-acetylglucosaminidase D [Porticoccaceae bacterium]|jgi:endo-beta-N-acetylglucosaminidase D